MNLQDTETANSARRRVQSNFYEGETSPDSHERDARKVTALESIALELNLIRQALGELILTVRHHQ